MNPVQKFYNALPFNKAPDKIILDSIKTPGTPWPKLTEALGAADSVLELGCGNGWLSNRIAFNWPKVNVIGIDLIQENIDIANRTKTSNSEFHAEDILLSDRSADIVISVGVLHHIPQHNIKDLMTLAINRSRKYAFIGLYHTQSRQAMFDFFSDVPENKRYKLFQKMTPWFKDETQRKSWYRDQLEHPYEVTVTLQDYQDVQQLTGANLVWTSIDNDNNYEITMQRLKSYEFTSGFIYGLYSLQED
jgi:trans-aconitate methyltransferase